MLFSHQDNTERIILIHVLIYLLSYYQTHSRAVYLAIDRGMLNMSVPNSTVNAAGEVFIHFLNNNISLQVSGIKQNNFLVTYKTVCEIFKIVTLKTYTLVTSCKNTFFFIKYFQMQTGH